jgi:tetratricopeptide (TPR) repeat protein
MHYYREDRKLSNTYFLLGPMLQRLRTGTHISLTGCIRTWLATALMSLLLWLPSTSAADLASGEERLRRNFQEAESRFAAARTNATAAWQFGRAAYELADVLRDVKECVKTAEAGVEACRLAISRNPNSAPAHYYLALNLGETARARKIGALKLLHEMEHELLTAKGQDALLDYGGPDRALGLLYLEAPSWPMSIGNKKKARAHLETAVDLSPDYPENRICLAEAYAKWGEARNLGAELTKLENLEGKARTQFNGPEWTAVWEDRQDRLYKLRRAQEHIDANTRVAPPDHSPPKIR